MPKAHDPHQASIHKWHAAGGSRVVHSQNTETPLNFSREKEAFIQDVTNGPQMLDDDYGEEWLEDTQVLYDWSMRQADTSLVPPPTTASGAVADKNWIDDFAMPENFTDDRDPDVCLEKEKEFATYVYRSKCKNDAKNEMAMFVFFLIVVLYGGFAKDPTPYYLVSKHVRYLMTELAIPDSSFANSIATFEDIGSDTDLKSWFFTLPTPVQGADGKYYLSENLVLMGGYGIRMLVSEQAECWDRFNFNHIWTDNGTLNVNDAPYNLNCISPDKYQTGGNITAAGVTWVYEDAETYDGDAFPPFNDFYSYNTRTQYPAGGYRFNMIFSDPNLVTTLAQMETSSAKLITSVYQRAVIIEFSTYSPVEGVLTAVRLLYEVSSSGTVYTQSRFSTFNMQGGWTWKGGYNGDLANLPLFIWRIILVAFLVNYTRIVGQHIKAIGWHDYADELRGNPQVPKKRHLVPLREIFDELRKSPENIDALRRNGLLDADNTGCGERFEVKDANGESYDPPVYEMKNAVDRHLLFDRLIVAVDFQYVLYHQVFAGSPCYGSVLYWALYKSHRWAITWDELEDYLEVQDYQQWALDFDSAMWEYLDLINLAMLWLDLILSSTYIMAPEVNSYDVEYAAINYVDIMSIARYNEFLHDFYGINMLVTTLKTLKYCQVQSDINAVWQTFVRAADYLGSFLIIFSTFFFSFTVCAMLLFGPELRNFYYIYSATVSMMQGLLGKVDYDSLMRVQPVLSLYFTAFFLWLILVVQINMFLSIMNTAYRLNAVRKGKQVAAARFAIDEEELRIIAKAKEDGQHLTREMAHMQVPKILASETHSLGASINYQIIDPILRYFNTKYNEVVESVESDSESSSESDSDEEGADGVELNSGVSLDKDRQEKIVELAALSLFSAIDLSSPHKKPDADGIGSRNNSNISLDTLESLSRQPSAISRNNSDLEAPPISFGVQSGGEPPKAPRTPRGTASGNNTPRHKPETRRAFVLNKDCHTENEFKSTHNQIRVHYATLVAEQHWDPHEHASVARILESLAEDADREGLDDIAQQIEHTATGIRAAFEFKLKLEGM